MSPLVLTSAPDMRLLGSKRACIRFWSPLNFSFVDILLHGEKSGAKNVCVSSSFFVDVHML